MSGQRSPRRCDTVLSLGGINHRVIAALNIGMTVVARDQQEGVPALGVQGATGRQSETSDLSTVADGECVVRAAMMTLDKAGCSAVVTNACGEWRSAQA